MGEKDILVICGDIYNSIQDEPKCVSGKNVKVNNNWYFAAGESSAKNFVQVLDDEYKFRLILIHSGNGDKNSIELRNSIPNAVYKIHGFHKINDEVYEKIKSLDTDWLIIYCEKKTLKEIIHSFLPLDIDMQALEMLWNNNREEALSFFKDMRKYWTDEILFKKWAQANEPVEQISKGSVKEELSNYTSSEFLALLNNISDGKWNGNNNFHNWYLKINSLITNK